MLGTIFKTLGFFLICFLILCIPIKEKTLFDYLFRASRPVGKIIVHGTETGIKKTQRYGRKLFLNSNPSFNSGDNQDEVRSVNSSTKKIHKTNGNHEALDRYSSDEAEALNQTIEQE